MGTSIWVHDCTVNSLSDSLSCSGCIKPPRVIQSLLGKDRRCMGQIVNNGYWMTVGGPVNDIRSEQALGKKPYGRRFCARGKVTCRTVDNSICPDHLLSRTVHCAAVQALNIVSRPVSSVRDECNILAWSLALLGCSVISW